MATLEDLIDMEGQEQERKEKEKDGDVSMEDAKKDEDEIDPDILNASTADILTRKRLLENEVRVLKTEFSRLNHERNSMVERIKDNQEKIENNRYAHLRLLRSPPPFPSTCRS
jgi:26S proteasome regulatory subunit T5